MRTSSNVAAASSHLSSALNYSQFQLAIFEDVVRGRGHTVVIARAGSGKTSTIVEALKYVPTGYTVLLVAFGTDIAAEMAARAPKGVTVSTLHSYGLSLIRRTYGNVTVDKWRGANIVRAVAGGEDAEYLDNLKKVVGLAKGCLFESAEDVDDLMDAFGVDIKPERRVQFVKDVCTALAHMANPRAVGVPVEAGKYDGAYTVISKDEGGKPLPVVIDFDDMIWLPIKLDLRPRTYARIFVDETQDLNACQLELAIRACAPKGRICAVGDDKQAIYRFRGADENAIARIIARLSAKVLPLSVSYRCDRAIVEYAQMLVPDFEAAPGAAAGEVVNVSHDVMLRSVRPGDFILSRTNAPLVALCMRLLLEGRRANIQGRDIGKALAAFVRRSKCTTVAGLCEFVEAWRDAETARLMKKNPPADTQGVADKAACILALSHGARSVDDVIATIEKLFADGTAANTIMLSSTHKAKGLERDRVYVLQYTYQRRPGAEEDNLAYVAYTRARHSLFLVSKPLKSEE